MSEYPDRLALVTGTSSGIGNAVARELLRRGWRVVGAARRHAPIESLRYSHLPIDLANLGSLTTRLDAEMGDLLANPALKRLALVNNAADPGLLGPLERVDAVKLLELYAVNVAAPISLMGWLIRRGRSGMAMRIVNVSSGAAADPYPGLGAYGSSKAALRMAGRVLAAELDARDPANLPGDAAILSYEPGIVDTEMQTAVRGSSKEIVPMVEMFKQFAAEGRLVPPSVPAAEIVEYLEADGHARFTERRLGVSPTGASKK